MNLLDSYYESIIYQKDAISTLSGILSKHFMHKKVFFISSKTAYKMFGTCVVNQLNRAGCEFVFKFIDKTDTKKEWEEFVGEAKTCGVLVALGAGGVADCAKYIAHLASLPYILIASLPSTTAYFSNYCFVQDGFLCQKVATHQPFKILIDENVIAKASMEQVQNGFLFVQSFYESVLNVDINNLLFEKKQYSGDIKLVLAKCKDSQATILSGSTDGKLLLMDTLVDLGKALSEIDSSFQTSLNLAMLLRSSGAIKSDWFGTLIQTASQMLIESYKKFFALKKIDVYTFLDIEALADHLDCLQISANNVKLKNIKAVRQNPHLFLKINAVKNQILYLIGKNADELCKFDKKQRASIDLSKCLMSFHILPYVYDCSCITNILSGSGLIS